jgi:HK97 family phage prohead protease
MTMKLRSTILRKEAPSYATKDFALEIKAVSDEEGTFEGYGSIFGNLDSYGEKVMPGAFSESLARHKREGTKPLMLWQHDPYAPIGVWEDLVEDGKGLRGTGRLLKGVAKADEARILMKAGALQGLSIGYREVEVEPEGNNRLLKKLDLLEISVVSFPANRRARVESIKSERMEEFARRLRDGDPMPIKDFEDILREAGVPKAMATQIASVGYAKAIRGEPEGQAKDADLRALKDVVQSFHSLKR